MDRRRRRTMERTLGPDHFEALLGRLSSDRDVAGARYEQLRRRLLTVFAYRGCRNAEDLVDETLDRVARRLAELGPAFEGDDPAPFVFGVAWNVAKESFKRPPLLPLDEIPVPAAPTHDAARDDQEDEHECLSRCLRCLSGDERDLVLAYYREERRRKIRLRSDLAIERHMTANALRLRIHRIVRRLRECVRSCVDEGQPPVAGAQRALRVTTG